MRNLDLEVAVVVRGKRKRTRVNYVALHDQLFGAGGELEAADEMDGGEEEGEDEEFVPSAKRSHKASAARPQAQVKEEAKNTIRIKKDALAGIIAADKDSKKKRKREEGDGKQEEEQRKEKEGQQTSAGLKSRIYAELDSHLVLPEGSGRRKGARKSALATPVQPPPVSTSKGAKASTSTSSHARPSSKPTSTTTPAASKKKSKSINKKRHPKAAAAQAQAQTGLAWSPNWSTKAQVRLSDETHKTLGNLFEAGFQWPTKEECANLSERVHISVEQVGGLLFSFDSQTTISISGSVLFTLYEKEYIFLFNEDKIMDNRFMAHNCA